MKKNKSLQYEKYCYSKIDEVLTSIKSSLFGLTEQEAQKRLINYGPNIVATESTFTIWKLLFRQIQNLLVLILLIAAIISFFISSFTDALIILIIVALNIIVGFIQEYKAEQTLRSIKKLVSPYAIVLRDNKKKKILIEDIVPGDILILNEGDRIAADARIISCTNFSTDESMFTGESHAKYKSEEKIKTNALLTEMDNMVFMGTTVRTGHGQAVVLTTGKYTLLGEIGHLTIKQTKKSSPLQKELDQVAKKISIVVFFICAGIFTFGILAKKSFFSMFMYSLSVAVALIPEGLPATVTIALAIGVQQLIKRKALVKKLASIETLGCTNIICTDKTGTLTFNKMTVKELFTFNRLIKLNHEEEKSFDKFYKTLNLAENLLIKNGVICNNALLDEKGEFIGDPTESALCILAEKAHMHIDELRKNYVRVLEKTFESKRKIMSVLCKTSNGLISFTKGSPNKIIRQCKFILSNENIEPLTKEKQKILNNINSEMADRALRVLAFAYKQSKNNEEDININTIETDMIFIGFIGMMDPPRTCVKSTINECRRAGIRVMMITGDQSSTAYAIAKNIGLANAEDNKDIILTGKELEAKKDNINSTHIDIAKVFAEVNPYQKNIIVSFFQNTNLVIAMTGDGVNDAPALKSADIGIAMGSGMDISKQVADMILLDDSFTTIVEAIRFGRGIYENIKKFIIYVFAGLSSELFVVLASVFSPLPLAITAVQILWIDLGMEVLPALALSVEPTEDSVMFKPPRSKKENLLNKNILGRVVYIALWQSIILISLFLWALKTGSLQRAQTLVFTTLIMFQMFNVFNCRSFEESLFSKKLKRNKYIYITVGLSVLLHLGVVYLPFANKLFGTVPLSFNEWLIILTLAVTVIPFVEIIKFFRRRHNNLIKY